MTYDEFFMVIMIHGSSPTPNVVKPVHETKIQIRSVRRVAVISKCAHNVLRPKVHTKHDFIKT
jgi:hypothetical protein